MSNFSLLGETSSSMSDLSGGRGPASLHKPSYKSTLPGDALHYAVWHGRTSDIKKIVLDGEKKVWLGNKFPPVWNLEVGLSCTKENKITISDGDIVQLDPRILDYVSEINLPLSKGWIEFKASQDGAFKCRGSGSRSVQSVVSPPAKWIDPYNWQSTQSLPHLETIPCWYDKVFLESPFKIEFPSQPIRVGSIVIDNEDFTTSSSLRYFTSHSQLFMLSNSPNNDSRLSGMSTCSDMTGCECGNEVFRDEVCGTIECEYKCSSGIKPKNHCCYNVCGALIHFTTYELPEKMKLSTLDRIIRSSYYDKSSVIEYHISKVSESEYEIIFVNTNGSIASAQSSAKRVEAALKRNFQDTSTYYIWTEYSGVDSASASNARKAFVGIFGACIFGALGYTAVKAYRRPNSSLRLGVDSYKESAAKQLSQWRERGAGGGTLESFSRFENPDVELTQSGNGDADPPSALPSFSFKELKSSIESPSAPSPDASKDDLPVNDSAVPSLEKKGVENPAYVEVSLTTDEEKINDRMGIVNPTYGEDVEDEDKIRDRLGIDNPSYGQVGTPEDSEDKVRDRLGLDNPNYGEDVLEEEDSKIRDRLGIENPVYSEARDDNDDDRIRDRLGIENPIYSEAGDVNDDRIRDRLGMDNPVYAEVINEEIDQIKDKEEEGGLEKEVEGDLQGDEHDLTAEPCMEFGIEDEEEPSLTSSPSKEESDEVLNPMIVEE